MIRNCESVLKEFIIASNSLYFPYRIVFAKELKAVTNNHDKQNIINRAFYSILHQEFWQDRLISVTRFDKSCKQWSSASSINNTICASQISHKHTLKLIGCCLETLVPILIFRYAEYRTLVDHIQGPPYHQCQFEPLPLMQSLKIAIDVANALAYLPQANLLKKCQVVKYLIR